MEFEVSERTIYRWLTSPSLEQAIRLYLWMGYDFTLEAFFQGPDNRSHPIYDNVPASKQTITQRFESLTIFDALPKNNKPVPA